MGKCNNCLDCVWCKFLKGWADKQGNIREKAKLTCDAGNWVSSGLAVKTVKYWVKKGNDLIAPYSPHRINAKLFHACSLFEDGRE